MKFVIRFIIFFGLVIFSSLGFAQDEPIIIDKVIAVIGDEIATKSELEAKYSGMVASGMVITDNTRCEILEDVLYSKILLNQAKLDSVEVSDAQVESEMDRRLRYYISQIGSEEKMVEYYKKSLSQMKDELRKSIGEQLLLQTMQGNITSDVSVTPDEVKQFYEKIPSDSLPLMNASVEVAQIVINAKTTQSAIDVVKGKLNEYRDRVNEGEKFATLAVLYSEDEASAVKGGEIGFVGKAEVEPEFSAASFKLKSGQVSPVIKTRYGYHIIQLIERRGNKVNVRHILIKPKQDLQSFEKAKSQIDSIANLIARDSIPFELAAKRYSEDDETKKNGGILVNPYTTSSMTEMDDLDPSLFFVIDKMDVGDISEAVRITDPRKQPGFRIVRLNKRTEPHRANLKEDYQAIKTAAKAEKEQEVLVVWIRSAVERTYVKIADDYSAGCKFVQPWTENTK